MEPFSSRPAPRVASERPRGIDVRLHERQLDLRGGGNASWRAVEYAFLTGDGVADRSRLELTFDPGYETLVLNELAIRRGDETQDRLDDARIRLIDLEPELDAGLYYGKRALSIILDDVRVGDVLRYAYTLDGINPVLDGRREHSFSTERRRYSEGRARLRVLSDPATPLNVRVRSPAPTPTESVADGVRETILDLPSVSARPMEKGVPYQARTRGAVVVSDVADWKDVVGWARPMYALPEETPAELVDVAAGIRAASVDERARIGAALRWVQDEIRYFGIQLGADSHRPAAPPETLERRFGDCKGKALLLVALLAELGVEAHVALVDTDERRTAPGSPWRLHAFDHVVVRVMHEGVSHWLDPTRSHQRGSLGDLGEADHGRALVLAAGVDELEDMTPPQRPAGPFVDKRLTVPDDVNAPATLEVLTYWPAAHAGWVRARLEREGALELGDDWLAYYRKRFKGASSLAPLEAVERQDGGLDTVERYAVPFWKKTKAGRRQRWLRDDEIHGEPDDPPPGADRVQPFSLEDLRPLEERWTVELPRPATISRTDSTLETAWFRYTKTHSGDPSGTTHVFHASFIPLADEVAPDALDDYADALEQLAKATAFRIRDEPPGHASRTGVDRWAETLYNGREAMWEQLLIIVGPLVLGVSGLHRYRTIRPRTEERATRTP